MTASAWVAVGSLGVGIILHMIAAAFFYGKQSQRLSHVEQAVGDRASTGDTVIELKVKMEHVEAQMQKQSASLEGINRQLGNIAMGRIGLSGELK